MSYLSPVDSTQVYFQPLDADDDEQPQNDWNGDGDRDRTNGYPRTNGTDDNRAGWGERYDRVEDQRERFEEFRERGTGDFRDGDRGRDDRCGDRDGAPGVGRFEGFERFERARLEDSQTTHPLPRF